MNYFSADNFINSIKQFFIKIHVIVKRPLKEIKEYVQGAALELTVPDPRPIIRLRILILTKRYFGIWRRDFDVTMKFEIRIR